MNQRFQLVLNGNHSRNQHIGSSLCVAFLSKYVVPDIDSDLIAFKRDIELNLNIIASQLHLSAEKLWSEWVTFHDTVCYWMPKYKGNSQTD